MDVKIPVVLKPKLKFMSLHNTISGSLLVILLLEYCGIFFVFLQDKIIVYTIYSINQFLDYYLLST